MALLRSFSDGAKLPLSKPPAAPRALKRSYRSKRGNEDGCIRGPGVFFRRSPSFFASFVSFCERFRVSFPSFCPHLFDSIPFLLSTFSLSHIETINLAGRGSTGLARPLIRKIPLIIQVDGLPAHVVKVCEAEKSSSC